MAEDMMLSEDDQAKMRAHNESGKAPGCMRCGHMLVLHGAGQCLGGECACPSDNVAWDVPVAGEES